MAKKKHYLFLAPASIHKTTFANINDFVVGVSDVMGLTENISKNFPKVLQELNGTYTNKENEHFHQPKEAIR